MADRETVWQMLQDEALLDEATLQSLRQQSEETGASPLKILVENAETIRPTAETPPSADTAPSNSPEEQGLPLADWDRFHIKRFINRGGMGEVYQAYDPRLNRMVAIKLLTSQSPSGMARFVREAKHQAGVHHPHICPIFETGMERGKAYIAMQYIDGQDLMTASRQITLQEKLRLFIQIANGLHEAHRQGLIHRDIKPGNILVEDNGTDQAHAYLLDFGLARNMNEASHTRTGDMMGTPAYMAPEQALGELHLIDRHTDIYSLGCTMYKVISGNLPFTGDSDLEILNQAIQGELRSLRSVAPQVPHDVDTIVMKCLQTKARDRYESALALSDDLQRFLNGESILARPTSLRERLLIKARKHKAMVGLASVASLLLLMALLWGWNLRREAAIRQALTQDYISRVEQIEALSRYMHMAPLHDLTQNHQQIRDHMDRIEQDMARVGDLATGPGHYALGRGLMVLNQPEKALEHLQQAWDSGFQEARVAHALSRVLGGMYQHALVQVERISRQGPREKQRQAIKARYGEPALKYARLASESGRVAGDGQALMAFYAGDYEQALNLLEEVDQHQPWLYELDKLSGDVLLAQANGLAKTDQSAAIEKFDQARSAYTNALRVGQSDPTLYLAQAQLDYAQMLMNAQTGNPLDPFFQNGLDHLENALLVHPQWDVGLLQKATFLRRKGIAARRKHSDKAQLWFEQAIATCQIITRDDPDHDLANDGLARALTQLAQLQKELGKDPKPLLTQALACFQRVGESYRDSFYYNDLGLAYKIRADYAQSRGESVLDDRKNEVHAYDQAIAYDKTAAAPLINKATALLDMASQSPNPMAPLEAGIQSLEKALQLSPQNIAIHYYLGILLIEMAYQKNMNGQAFAAAFQRAQEVYGDGIQLSPKSSFLHNGLSRSYVEQALMEMEHGQAPDPYLEAAVKHGNDALEVAANDHFALVNMGQAFSIWATHRLDQGQDPGTLLEKAQDKLDKAAAIAPNSAWIQTPLGEVWYLKAVRDLTLNKDPKPSLAKAQEILEAVLRDNPHFDKAHFHLARLHHLRMQKALSREQEWQPMFEQALAALAQVKKTRFDKHQLLLGYLHYHQARQQNEMNQKPQEAIQAGLKVIDDILQKRPLAEALALRSGLRSLEAQDDAAANTAARDLEQAFKQNPLLRVSWQRKMRP